MSVTKDRHDRLVMVSHHGQEARTIRAIGDWLEDVRTHRKEPVLVELKVSKAPNGKS